MEFKASTDSGTFIFAGIEDLSDLIARVIRKDGSIATPPDYVPPAHNPTRADAIAAALRYEVKNNQDDWFDSVELILANDGSAWGDRKGDKVHITLP